MSRASAHPRLSYKSGNSEDQTRLPVHTEMQVQMTFQSQGEALCPWGNERSEATNASP